MNKEMEDTTTKQRAILISTVFTIVAALALVGLIIQVALTDASATPIPSIIGVGAVGLLTIASLVGRRYCQQGRINLGLGLIGLGFLVIVLVIPFIVQGRAVYTAPVAVALVVAVVPQLFSLRIANRVVTVFVVAGILSIALDAWLPFARITPTEQPYAIYVFLVGLLVFIAYAAVNFRRFKLRTKLLTFLVFMPLIIVAVIGVFFIVRVSGQQQAQVETAIQQQLTQQADELVTFLDDAEADIQLLSHSFALDYYLSLAQTGASAEAVAAAKTAVQSEFLNFAQIHPIYDQISFLDASGQEIVRIDSSSAGASTAITGDALQNKASRPYFAETAAKSAGEIYISPLELNAEQGMIERPFTPVIRYGMPLYHAGELQGVVVTNVLADNFLQPLITQDRTYYLVDQNGYFLFHPDPDKRWARDLQTGAEIAVELPAAANLLGSEPGVQFVETQTDFVAVTPISLSQEASPRWYLLSITPLQAILSPLNNLLAPIQFVLAIALMLTPLVAFFVSQSVATPIVRLSRAAEQMGQGNFNVSIEATSEDEVGVLARTLQAMNAELAELIGSLESRVQARTQDLTLAVEVSNQIAQVNTLEVLLANAVNLIRDRFDLYYTQIYLVEGSTLRLKAGSGEVGQRLLEQGHKLAIGPGSINGTAASEKRSLIVADTAASPTFRPNALLPLTRSELAVPLIAQDKVVGVLNLQSTEPNALTQENLNAFEALAGQLASAIENAHLFAELNEARAVVEAQMKQLTSQGWNEFLDGIHNREFVGYAFEDGKITAVTKPSPLQPNQQKWEIEMLGAALGQFVVEQDTEKPLSPAAEELIQNVSREVAQHLENLRLLADARRYQQEAEALAHRLIQDRWQAYQEETAVSGFIYDQQQVKAVHKNDSETTADWLAPLKVGGTQIGQISLSRAETPDQRTQEILTAVTARLSAHIENLRLSEESEAARADAERRSQELAVINEVAQSVSQLLQPADLLETIFKQVQRTLTADAFIVAMYDEQSGMLNYPLVYDSGQRFQPPTGRPDADNPWLQVVQTGQPHLINRTPAEVAQRLAAGSTQRLGQPGKVSASLIFVPLYLGQKAIGAISVQSYDEAAYNERDLALLEGIANHVAVALENARLYAETQKRAEREALVNQITQKIQSTITIENALQTAVAELGQALKAKHAAVTLNLESKENGHS